MTPGAPPPRAPVRVAVVDVGSNSVRLAIADVSARGRITPVDRLRATPRLGAGVHATGALHADAMREALEVLGRMAALAREQRADRVVAVATSAVREAANGAEFVRRVREATGLALRVLDGEEEARLAFRSARAHFDLRTGRSAVMDVGGGSLELALAVDGAPVRLCSHPLGVIPLTERFLGERPTPDDVRRLRRTVRDALRATLPHPDWRGTRLVGSGGTFTALGAILVARRGGGAGRRAHGTTVARGELEALVEELRALPPADRAYVPGLRPSRADVIVAGLAATAEVAALLDAPAVVASGYGIREGLLLESAEGRPVSADGPAAR